MPRFTPTDFHAGQTVAVTSQSARGQETLTRAAVARVLSTCVVLDDGDRYSLASSFRLRESRAPWHCVAPWTPDHDRRLQEM